MRCTIILILFSSTIYSQSLIDFNQKRIDTDKKLMLTLGGWSLANAAVSSIGWAITTGEAKQFHQMNTIWSGFNLALAIPGYLKARKDKASDYNFSQTIAHQNQTEKIFLFNAGLDLAYVTGGFYLRSLANTNFTNEQRLRGYGNSVILQGSFLFLFDLTAYLIHAQHRKNKLNPIIDKIELSDSGIGLKYNLGSKYPQTPLNMEF